MLTLTILGDELWDDDTEMFRYTEDIVLEFEHSLVTLSKWEAKFKKPFLTEVKREENEMYGYIKAMLQTPGISDEVLERLTSDNVSEINEYINDPMTGSTVSELPQTGPRSSEGLSAELIYFWMSQYQIPYEAREWHLNQLFTLIKIHHAKNQKPKKMNGQSRTQQMAELNAARKKKLNSTG